MSTKFFTNSNNNILLNKFKGIFENNPNIKIFHCVSGYFRASGYYHLRDILQKLSEVRILVGIDVDKIDDFYTKKNKLTFDKSNNLNEDYCNTFIDEVHKAEYTLEIENSIKDFVSDGKQNNIDVRIHKSKKLHAKIYIFLPEEYNEHKIGSVITGSSNFTNPGLGVNEHFKNYEFNVELRDYEDVCFAQEEFKKLWEDSEPVDWKKIVEELDKTHITKLVTPYDIFLKTLIEYFDDRIEYDDDDAEGLPQGYSNLRYQSDAVQEAKKMLLDYDGCFLADVVGLGKTVVATRIANELAKLNTKKKTRILVVYPPVLEHNWKETFKDFKIYNYTDFVSNGSLHKILDPNNLEYKYNAEDYSIIIVDEAHRYRYSNSEMYLKLNEITKTPIKEPGKVIQKKKVMLLSATPFNNKPEDLLNQISLFTDRYKSSLAIKNLGNYFAPKIAKYKEIIKDDKKSEELESLMSQIREDIIKPITVRRIRKDLENDMYRNDIETQGLCFPIAAEPTIFEYQLDDKLSDLFASTMQQIKKNLKYQRYQMISALKEEVVKEKYPDIEVALVVRNLSELMKTRMVKSLESSFDAFRSTLKRLNKSTEEMLNMIEKGKVYFAPNGKLNDWLDDNQSFEEIEKEIKKKSDKEGYNIFEVEEHFDQEKIKEAKKLLESDKKILNELAKKWAKIDYDPKFDKFTEELPKIIKQSENNPTGKLVIFSESKITCNYLFDKIKTQYNVLNISAANRKDYFTVIRENFDANYTKDKQKDDYQIIITTEVLAEGVNLHRSNNILNYDIPWNSTKLMQRIGRVNRLGSTCDKIYNYAFYPSVQGDKEIALTNKAHTKLQAFHYTFGEDSQVLSSKEKLIEVILHDSSQGEKQDEKLKYLEIIRKIKSEEPEYFNKLKKLSLKSRSIRKAKDEITTAVFLKIKEKSEFYLCKNNKVEAVDFIPFVKTLECNKNEPLLNNIPDYHFVDVNKAIEEFNRVDIEKEQAKEERNVDIKLKKTLKDLRDKETTQKEIQKKIVLYLEMGRYPNLRKEVDKLLKSSDFEKDLKLLANKYPDIEEKKEQDIIAKTDKPRIILSESFVKINK